MDKIEDINNEQVSLLYTDREGIQETLKASAILAATGRMPNTKGLNLEAAGIKTDRRGYIEVDEFLKTSAPSVWAMGDCNGGPQFTYISNG